MKILIAVVGYLVIIAVFVYFWWKFEEGCKNEPEQ